MSVSKVVRPAVGTLEQSANLRLRRLWGRILRRVGIVNAVNYNTSIKPESQFYKIKIKIKDRGYGRRSLAEVFVRFALLCEIRCATVRAL